MRAAGWWPRATSGSWWRSAPTCRCSNRSGDRWIVGGRGEPLFCGSKPEKLATPEAVRVRERTAEGTTRAGTMVEADPGAIPLRVSALAVIVDLRA